MAQSASDQFVKLIEDIRADRSGVGRGSGLDAVVRAVLRLGIADVVTITEKVAGGGMTVVASSDHEAAPLGDTFDDTDPSPCTTAALLDEIVYSPDITLDNRWPRWIPETVAHGIRAVISVILHRESGPLGCLNLYWHEPHDIDSDDLDIARLAAMHASIELAHHRNEVELWRAIDARHLIGQAQGLLMAQFGIDTAQAFALLRRLSQNTNTKLSKVAEQIVADRRLDVGVAAPEALQHVD